MPRFWTVFCGYALLQHCCPPRCHSPKYAHKSVLYQRSVLDFEKAVPQYQILFLQDRHAYRQRTSNVLNVARQFFCETRTEFLRKNSPVLRSKSETRSLASTAPKMEGAAHVKGRVLAWGGAAFAAPPLAFCPWGSSYPSVASPASSAASWAATGSVYSDQP